jgi:transposase
MSIQEARYNYRLRVSPSQQRALKDVFDTCRFVWNKALGDWIDEWKENKTSIAYAQADKALMSTDTKNCMNMAMRTA